MVLCIASEALLLTLFAVAGISDSQLCPATPEPEGPAAEHRLNWLSGDVDDAFLLTDSGITCHGIINGLSFYHGAQLNTCKNVTLMVWRLVDYVEQIYMLRGQKTVLAGTDWSCDDKGEKSFDFLPSETIAVRPGDFYGWRDEPWSSHRPIEYDRDGSALPLSCLVICRVIKSQEEVGEKFKHCQCNGNFPIPEAVTATGGMLILPVHTGCSYKVGDTCSWLTHQYAGNATRVEASFSLQVQVKEGPTPKFTNLPSVVNVIEELGGGLEIYTAGGERNVNSDSSGLPLVYSISSSDTEDTCHHKFAIDAETGLVTTTGPLDFETFTTCSVEIMVEDWPYSFSALLLVNVINVRESKYKGNLPADAVFRSSGAHAGREIFDVDVLTSSASPIRYRLVNSVPYFDLFAVDGERGLVTIIDALQDWTESPLLEITVAVHDNISAYLPSPLYIGLDDLRRPPVVTNLPHTILLRDGLDLSTPICQVEGVALPDGRGDPLTYHIAHVIPQEAEDMFIINKASGLLYLHAVEDLTYEEYEVHVAVEDGDGLYTSTPSYLRIMYQGTIHHFQFPQDAYNFEIMENMEVNAMIGSFGLPSLVDEAMSFTLEGDQAWHFFIDNDPPMLYLRRQYTLQPDLASETLQLELFAADNSGVIGTALIFITVFDANNHAPVFSEPLYQVHIPDDALPGSFVGEVTATDDDYGLSGQLSFRLTNATVNPLIYIDADGNIIIIRPLLGSDNFPQLLVVVAADNGTPSLSSSTLLKVVSTTASPRVVCHPASTVVWVPDTVTAVDASSSSIVATLKATETGENTAYVVTVFDDNLGLDTETGAVKLLVASTGESLPTPSLFVIYAAAAAATGSLKTNTFTSELDDMCRIAVGVFSADAYLVVMTLKLRHGDFVGAENHLKQQLEKSLFPWSVSIYTSSPSADRINTEVHIYCIEGYEEPDETILSAVFIDADVVVRRFTSPKNGALDRRFRGAEFAVFQPLGTETHNNHKARRSFWKSAGGITVIVFSVIAAVVLIVVIALVINHRYKRGVKRTETRMPESLPHRPDRLPPRRNRTMYIDTHVTGANLPPPPIPETAWPL